jgi:hypothetical protein
LLLADDMPSETIPRLLDLDGSRDGEETVSWISMVERRGNTAYFGPDGQEARKAASGLLMGRGDANNRIGPFFILDGANIRGPHDQTDTSAVV